MGSEDSLLSQRYVLNCNMKTSRAEQQGTVSDAESSSRSRGFGGCTTGRISLCLMTLFFVLAASAQVRRYFKLSPLYFFSTFICTNSSMTRTHYYGWCVSLAIENFCLPILTILYHFPQCIYSLPALLTFASFINVRVMGKSLWLLHHIIQS